MDFPVFVSWSGPASQRVAEALRHALQQIFDQRLKLWISTEDLRKGSNWRAELTRRLVEARAGIVCLTDDNRRSDWLLFESGALALSHEDARPLFPYVLGDTTSVKDPVGLFQSTRADRDDTWRLVSDLNELIEHRINPDTLRKRYDLEWPQLEAELAASRALVRGDGARLLTSADLRDPSNGLTWAQLADRCEERMLIAGWSCRNVVTGNSRPVFRSMLTRGRKLDLLVLHPDAITQPNPLKLAPVCQTTDEAHVANDCRLGRTLIETFATEVAAPNLELRGTDWFMAWSCVAVDHQRPTGLLQIELYQYFVPIAQRLNVVMTSASPHYAAFAHSLDEIWKAASVLTPPGGT